MAAVSRRHAQFAAAAFAVLLSACSSASIEVGGPLPSASTMAPVDGVTAVSIGDVAWHEDVAALAAHADLVVQVHVASSEVLEYVHDSSYLDSDDPLLNPYAGASRTPSAAEVEAASTTVATLYNTTATDVVAGSADAGDEVRVWQNGGSLGGVDHLVHGLVPLADIQGDPLLFLTTQNGEDFWVVGGTQGILAPTSGGTFQSVAEGREDLIFHPADREVVASLVG